MNLRLPVRHIRLKKPVQLVHETWEGHGKTVIDVSVGRREGKPSLAATIQAEGYTTAKPIDQAEAKRLIREGGIGGVDSVK